MSLCRRWEEEGPKVKQASAKDVGGLDSVDLSL